MDREDPRFGRLIAAVEIDVNGSAGGRLVEQAGEGNVIASDAPPAKARGYSDLRKQTD
jgi:hypothetical protein